MCISRVNKSFIKKIIYHLDIAPEMVYNIYVIKKQSHKAWTIMSEEEKLWTDDRILTICRLTPSVSQT